MRKPDFQTPVHDGALLSWHGKHAYVEASSLGPLWKARLWDDAADVGFAVRSQRTGKVLLFSQVSEVRLRGELVSSTFESDTGCRVTVYND